MALDYEALREDLLDYFGTGWIEISNIGAMLDKVMSASNDELLSMAYELHLDLSKYEISYGKKLS